MVTRRGICYKLKDSEYIVVVDDIKFYFSSRAYMRKFYEGFMNNREIMKETLMKKYNTNCNFNTMFDLVFYEKLELRGFYVTYKGVEFECLEEINLFLEEKINKS